MKKLMDFIDALNKKYFSSEKQLQRIVILTAVVLVLAVGSFAGYYWYDRYYQPQPKAGTISLAKAEQAVRDDPSNIDARTSLANAYMIQARWNDAITQIQEAKKVKPNDVTLDFMLGISYANTFQCDTAIPLLQKYVDSQKGTDMLGLNRQYQAALYYQGDCYLRLNQPENAVNPLIEAVTLSKTDADALYKLGVAFQGVQRYDDAVTALQRATAFVPNYSEAYTSLAEVYDAMGKKPEASYARAMVSYSKKDYEAAYPILLQATKDAPSFEPAFTGLGLTCEAKKDLQCALSAYSIATKLDSVDISASQGLLRIQALLKQ